MAIAALNLRVRNNDDWTRSFQLIASAGTQPPWNRVAAWTPNTNYQSNSPASVVTYGGDLLVANPGTNPGSFTSGSAYDSTQWLKVGVGALWGRVPYDLTNCQLKMGIALADRTLVLSTADGTLLIVDAINGYWRFNYPYPTSSAVPAGTYACDLVVIRGGRRVPAFKGSLTVESGVTP